MIKQEFTQPGQYILTLEVFNPVSSIFYTQAVDVYGRYLNMMTEVVQIKDGDIHSINYHMC